MLLVCRKGVTRKRVAGADGSNQQIRMKSNFSFLYGVGLNKCEPAPKSIASNTFLLLVRHAKVMLLYRYVPCGFRMTLLIGNSLQSSKVLTLNRRLTPGGYVFFCSLFMQVTTRGFRFFFFWKRQIHWKFSIQ